MTCVLIDHLRFYFPGTENCVCLHFPLLPLTLASFSRQWRFPLPFEQHWFITTWTLFLWFWVSFLSVVTLYLPKWMLRSGNKLQHGLTGQETWAGRWLARSRATLSKPLCLKVKLDLDTPEILVTILHLQSSLHRKTMEARQSVHVNGRATVSLGNNVNVHLCVCV